MTWHGAADVEAGERGQVEGFGRDALAGEGGVAVDDDGQDLLLCLVVAAMRVCQARARPMTTGSTASRWLGLEARWRATVWPLGDGVLAGGAHVVLDVAAAQVLRGIDVFELGEDLGGRAADGVGHDVEAAAMAHGEDGARDAVVGGGGEDLIEERDEDGEAFEGEALGAEVALLDDLLEEVGADELR